MRSTYLDIINEAP